MLGVSLAPKHAALGLRTSRDTGRAGRGGATEGLSTGSPRAKDEVQEGRPAPSCRDTGPVLGLEWLSYEWEGFVLTPQHRAVLLC